MTKEQYSSLEAILHHFDEEQISNAVVAMSVQIEAYKHELPMHWHRLGQLIFTAKGGVSCKTQDTLWMVPPQKAVWIPPHVLHSVKVTENALVNYVFIQPNLAVLPDACCTLAISPLLKELILSLSKDPFDYSVHSAIARKGRVLLDELEQMPVENLCLPTSNEPRIKLITHALLSNPADRRNLQQWGQYVAMSGRSLERLMKKETGLSFGQWRKQLYLIVAIHQLSEGKTVQGVAEQLGYDSITAFITMFKQMTGKTPGKYFDNKDIF